MNNQPGPHYRNQLNRVSQVLGCRIDFDDRCFGPQNAATWISVCMVNGVEYARASGPSKSIAKEQAAYQTLQNLRAQYPGLC
ncbi:hypothetical protein BDQ17DRAFT_1434461 [Cyathus striatus]|nr:hypothetical protein BDQ17DRAFT_1434461 [Cyathus striatus]